MIIAAIDPGTTESALVTFDGEEYCGWIEDNHLIRDYLVDHELDAVLIEKIESYGMAVGESVFETVRWCGRFHEAAEKRGVYGTSVHHIPRKLVKLTLCNSLRAKDANIRQALLDRFGGQDTAVGKKANPGKLYGFKSHMWAALAVLETWRELERAAA